jgi:hypothetical protein
MACLPGDTNAIPVDARLIGAAMAALAQMPFPPPRRPVSEEHLSQRGTKFGDGFWPIVLKKSLSTADQNFSRPLMRFSDKNVRDLVSK